jgi:hypothetical protein
MVALRSAGGPVSRPTQVYFGWRPSSKWKPIATQGKRTPRTLILLVLVSFPEKEAKRILLSLSRYVTFEQDQLAGLPIYVSLVAG